MRLEVSLLALALSCFGSAQVWEKPIAPGLTLRTEIDAVAPRIINGLRITFGAPELKLSAELAGGTINEAGTVKGRLAPARIAQQSKAVAAVNADFFNFEHGAPIGLMVRNGELLTSPLRSRAVFAWGEEVTFSIPSFKGAVVDSDGLNLALDGVNQPVGQNQLVVYTPAAGDVEVAGDNLMAFLNVEDAVLRPNGFTAGTVDVLLADSHKMRVPEGKLLLVARGTKRQALAALRPERKLRVRTETAGFDWSRVENAVGGGPFLLRNGVMAIDAEAEGFNAAFANGRHPRTAIGRTRAGDIWIVTIDGRQSMSIGANLRETAEVMQRLGCVDAINLDGGGSTNLHLLGVTVNRPSDKAERPVSNALTIRTMLPSSATGMKLIAPPSIAPGSSTTVELMLNDQEVPAAEVIWGMQGAGWIDPGGLVRALDPGKAVLTASYRGTISSATILVELPTPKPVVPAAIAPATKALPTKTPTRRKKRTAPTISTTVKKIPARGPKH